MTKAKPISPAIRSKIFKRIGIPSKGVTDKQLARAICRAANEKRPCNKTVINNVLMGFYWCDAKYMPRDGKEIRVHHDRENKIQPRDFAISFFRRFKQTDNIALCELIIDLTGWDRPDNNGQRHAMLKRFAREASCYERPTNRKTDKDFYNSSAWKTLRYIALKNTDGRCECCGATAQDGVKIHVDHIKPRSLHPDLELDLENMQILCGDCNVGKSNLDDTDWRIRM